MPCFSHLAIDSWMLRTFRAPPLRSLHAYVGIHAPNFSLAMASPVWCRQSFLVTDLERDAATVHPVRAVHHPRRTAGVHAGRAGLLLAEIGMLAFQDPCFLPEVVRDRLARLDPGGESQQPGHVAGLGVATEDLLVDPRPAGAAARRARDGLPGQGIGAEELVLRLGHGR